MRMRRIDNPEQTQNRESPKEGSAGVGSEKTITISRRAWVTLALLSRHSSDGLFLRDYASSCNTRNYTGL